MHLNRRQRVSAADEPHTQWTLISSLVCSVQSWQSAQSWQNVLSVVLRSMGGCTHGCSGNESLMTLTRLQTPNVCAFFITSGDFSLYLGIITK